MKIGFDVISDLNLSPEDSFNWEGAAGNIAINQTYFIASTSKLFASAIVFYLIRPP